MSKSSTRGIVLVAVALVLGAAAQSAAAPAEPVTKTVVMVDASGTYRSQRNEAMSRTTSLLEKIGSQKRHRWESASDQVAVISLDALPEVIWQGDLKTMKGMRPDAWSERFRARREYEGCTDVTAAFQLAARYLEGDSAVAKYLVIFSDLLHEPPTSSIRKCRAPQVLPAEGFPWDQLGDVSVSVFGMPAEQKLAWSRAVAEKSLTSSFSFYSAGESSTVELAPPPRRRTEMTEQEAAAVRAQMGGLLSSVKRGIGYLGLALLGVAVVIPVAARLLPRRRPVRGTGGTAIR